MKARIIQLAIAFPVIGFAASTALADDWGFNVSFGSRRCATPVYYSSPVVYSRCYSDVIVDPGYCAPVVRYYDAAPVYYNRACYRPYYGYEYYRPVRHCGDRYSSGRVRVYRR